MQTRDHYMLPDFPACEEGLLTKSGVLLLTGWCACLLLCCFDGTFIVLNLHSTRVYLAPGRHCQRGFSPEDQVRPGYQKHTFFCRV